MKATVSSIQQIEAYLNKRLSLPLEIINFLASEIYIRNHTEHNIQIMYRKSDDRIFTNKWDFNLRYILNRHYTQCACCGQWYTENLSGDFLSTSIITVYLSYKGHSKDLHICSPCTLEHEKTVTQIDDTLTAIEDELLSFSDAFYPLTHAKT